MEQERLDAKPSSSRSSIVSTLSHFPEFILTLLIINLDREIVNLA